MAYTEETFHLENHVGETMYGIIHHPPTPNGAVVIMFNIGLHYRVSHSRLFVRQARDLQAAGYRVVRIDTSKIGYSQGEIVADRAMEIFNAVQTGLFRDDAACLFNYVRERFEPEKLFLWGLCGGALTAFVGAALDGRVDGVISVAGPITVTSAEFETSTLSPLEARYRLNGYRYRLFNPLSWWRFLTGKTSYSKLFHSLKVTVIDRLEARKVASGKIDHGSAEKPKGDKEEKSDLYNQTFHEAFEKLVKRGCDVLFLMPELDQATFDFDRIFVPRFLPAFEPYREHFYVERVPKANHTFSTRLATRQLIEISRRWLDARRSA